jgi:3-oxoacyl-[acyl-carrier protein] reductase
MDLKLAGRRAAVAAASRGLGRACAAALAAEGARVAICGRNRAAVEAAAAELDLVPLVADVSTPDGARGFVRDARASLGGVDVLVANAGGPSVQRTRGLPAAVTGP